MGGAPTVIMRGAKVRLGASLVTSIFCLILFMKPQTSLFIFLFIHFSLCFRRLCTMYIIPLMSYRYSEQPEWGKNTKQPSNNIKRTYLFHLVFVCWHPSRAHWSRTVFTHVKCVCRSKRKENPPEIRQLKIQKVVSCASPNSHSVRSTSRFY